MVRKSSPIGKGDLDALLDSNDSTPAASPKVQADRAPSGRRLVMSEEARATARDILHSKDEDEVDGDIEELTRSSSGTTATPEAVDDYERANAATAEEIPHSHAADAGQDMRSERTKLKEIDPVGKVWGFQKGADPCATATAAQIGQQRPTVGAIYASLARVAQRLADEGIGKNSRNQAQKFNFRGIDDMYNVVGPLLAEEKIITLPVMYDRNQTERDTKNGGLMFDVTLRSTYQFVSTVDGSSVSVTVYGEGMDSGDKATNKAMSGAHKYALIQLFSIPIEGAPEERDPDFSSPEARKPNPRRESAPVREVKTDREPPKAEATREDPSDDSDPPFEADSPKGSLQAGEVERLINGLVKDPAMRKKIIGKLCDSFSVLTLDQLKPAQVREATQMVADFIKAQQARAAKG